MKSRKKISKRRPTPKRRELVTPPAVFEYVMLQLILRGSGFKSSELSTIIRPNKDNIKQSDVSIVVTRSIQDADKKHGIGVGIINIPLAKVKLAWRRWLTVASTLLIKNFDVWQKKSLAYGSMEAILISLEKAGFVINESAIDDTFDLTGTIH